MLPDAREPAQILFSTVLSFRLLFARAQACALLSVSCPRKTRMMQMFYHKIATMQDPNRPRRGMSAFMLFSNEFRAQVRLEMPDLSFGDVARELTRRWSDLPFDRKEVWPALSC